MQHPMSSKQKKAESRPYRVDLINAAMGARRLTNDVVAEKAGIAPKTVSAVRNGDPNVKVLTLAAVASAVGLTMEEVFRAA